MFFESIDIVAAASGGMVELLAVAMLVVAVFSIFYLVRPVVLWFENQSRHLWSDADVLHIVNDMDGSDSEDRDVTLLDSDGTEKGIHRCTHFVCRSLRLRVLIAAAFGTPPVSLVKNPD